MIPPRSHAAYNGLVAPLELMFQFSSADPRLCLPVLSFGVGRRRVQNRLVVLHVQHTFRVQLDFCADKKFGRESEEERGGVRSLQQNGDTFFGRRTSLT